MLKRSVPVFCCFWFSEYQVTKYSPNCKRKLFYEVLHRKTLDAQRGAAGGHRGPTPAPGALQPCWPRLAQVWPTWAGSESATSPIYSPRMENPKYSEKIPERSP